MRRVLVLLGLVAIAVALLTPAGRPAAAGGRTIAVDTKVEVVKVDNDGVFPFDNPEPGEGVVFRVTATANEKTKQTRAKKGEIWVRATVSGKLRGKPTIVGRQGLRCNAENVVKLPTTVDAWGITCRSSRVFDWYGEPLYVLIRVTGFEEEVVRVMARTVKARGVDSDLTVRSTLGERQIRYDPGDTWAGTWYDVPHTGNFWVLSQGGSQVTGKWMGNPALGTLTATIGSDGMLRGTFENKRDARKGEFELELEDEDFFGKWRHTDTEPKGPWMEWAATCTAGPCLNNRSILPPDSAGIAVSQPFSGDWSIQFSFSTSPETYQDFPGGWTFRQTGTNVCISYSGSGGGTGNGTVTDRNDTKVLTGDVSDSFGHSHFEVTLSGDHFVGTWSRDNLSGNLQGTKTGPPSRSC